MTRATLITTLAALAIITGAGSVAWSQETLKVAIPQRGAWDAGVAELGQRGGRPPPIEPPHPRSTMCDGSSCIAFHANLIDARKA